MTIDKDFLDILACPKCKGELALTEEHDELTCEKCRLGYEVRDGVPIMLIEEARNLDTAR